MTVLSRTVSTLPSSSYFDPHQYERELQAIWYRDWVCVGRLEEILRVNDFFVASIGTQQLIVTRDREAGLRAFHNTCRHRGSLLCREARGRFRNGRIVCPYHAWTYSTDGRLLATPRRIESEDFRMSAYPLHAVSVDTWGGFVFVCLADEPARPLAGFLGEEAENLAAGPLADLVSVHQEQTTLACNWKIFWENFSECYHCPRVHPELSRLVPTYGRAVVSDADLPGWRPERESDDGAARVRKGASTWSLDGRMTLPGVSGLDHRASEGGMKFASFTASMFVVGHPDYVRSVRLVPKGPEATELIVDWLLEPGARERHGEAMEQVSELGRLVIAQDGEVCELNQRG